MTSTLRREQVALIAFFIPLVFKSSVLPSRIAEVAGTDASLSIALLTIMEFLHLAVIVGIVLLGGVKKLSLLFGKWAAFAACAPLLFVYIVKTLVFSAEVVDYVAYFLFYNVAHWGIKAVFFLALFYIAQKGAKCFGRLAEISLLFLPIIFLYGLIFGKINVNPEYALPLFADGFSPIFSGFDSALFWAFDFSPLIFFEFDEYEFLQPNKKPRKHKFPYITIASIICFCAIVSMFFVFFINYGRAAGLVDHAFARLAAFNVVTTQVGSIEWPSIILWLISAVVCLSIKMFASGKTLELVGVKPRIGTGAAVACVTILSFFVVKEMATALKIAESAVRYAVIAVELICTFSIFFMLLAVKNKKTSKKEVRNETV